LVSAWAIAPCGTTPFWIGSIVVGLPPTEARLWPGRAISVPVSVTVARGRIAVALSETSPPVIPPIDAGFHHRLSAPVSAISPE